MSEGFDFVSRYDALGPPNGCDGDCEGTGWIPVYADDPKYGEEWNAAEAKQPTDDGAHFIRCPKCNPVTSAELRARVEKLEAVLREIRMDLDAMTGKEIIKGVHMDLGCLTGGNPCC